jgi:hypothetical protein
MKVTERPPRRVAEMTRRRHEDEGASTGRIHCKQVGRRDAHCDGDRGVLKTHRGEDGTSWTRH